MVNQAEFLRQIEVIRALKPQYKLGRSGSDGWCDCIGLIIGALRRSGGVWSGIHGSNWAARQEVDGLSTFTDMADLRLGDIVFKGYAPAQGGYNLPARYRMGGASYNGDVTDYYHVGVVTSVNPTEITHCTSPDGVKRDKTVGRWFKRGRLRQVSEGGSTMTGQEKLVTASTGSTVNLRAAPAPNGALLTRVPLGTKVNQTEDDGVWSRIVVNGQTGYMMSRFLTDTEGGTAEASSVETRLRLLEERVAALEGGIG